MAKATEPKWGDDNVAMVPSQLSPEQLRKGRLMERHNYAVIDMQLTEEILRYLDVQHYTLAAKKAVATMIATHRLKYGAPVREDE